MSYKFNPFTGTFDYYVNNIAASTTTDITGLLVGNGSVVSGITNNSANWNSAYAWGNHASAGYIKADGTVPLTANWEAGAFEVTMKNLNVDGDTNAEEGAIFFNGGTTLFIKGVYE